jgi:hypothetical protein
MKHTTVVTTGLIKSTAIERFVYTPLKYGGKPELVIRFHGMKPGTFYMYHDVPEHVVRAITALIYAEQGSLGRAVSQMITGQYEHTLITNEEILSGILGLDK